MVAGHLVLGAFLTIIFAAKAYVAAVPAVSAALFVSVLELLVSLIQAFVFTLLSVLFVGGMVHPEH
jgi:F-type H+-transporting ATPase subunit a